MMMKKTAFFLFVLVAFPFLATADIRDTAAVLKHLGQALKSIDNVSYKYQMDVKFPNGDKDHLDGSIHLDINNQLYYNNCPEFTLIYSDKWFYRADHRNKAVTIISRSKEDKKLAENRKQEIFKQGALNTFVDTMLLKRAVIFAFSESNEAATISMHFKGNTTIKNLTVTYNTKDGKVSKCSMEQWEPWQDEEGKRQHVQLTVGFDDFKYATDKSEYSESVFFSYDNKMLVLKKYNNYKLSKKI
ncbi:MAG: hypothetical protein V4649_02805 [Bacteroidota bacterium]